MNNSDRNIKGSLTVETREEFKLFNNYSRHTVSGSFWSSKTWEGSLEVV